MALKCWVVIRNEFDLLSVVQLSWCRRNGLVRQTAWRPATLQHKPGTSTTSLLHAGQCVFSVFFNNNVIIAFQLWQTCESSRGESQESYHKVYILVLFQKVFVLWTAFVPHLLLDCLFVNLYHSFQIESERWEALLIKHRTKAEQLERSFLHFTVMNLFTAFRVCVT